MRMMRLLWEAPSPQEASDFESVHGEDFWPRADWDALTTWHEVTVEFPRGDASRIVQYINLKKWEETREQPIRNVRLQRASHDIIWEDVDL